MKRSGTLALSTPGRLDDGLAGAALRRRADRDLTSVTTFPDTRNAGGIAAASNTRSATQSRSCARDPRAQRASSGGRRRNPKQASCHSARAHAANEGDSMDFKSLQRRAKQLIDRRGGTDSLKADAQELKDIAKGPGTVAEKAKQAGDALKDPGAKGPDTPTAPRPPTTETPAPSERAADAPDAPKPGNPPGA
ncbi:MAG TPA: hypothetical protein VK631_19620 [Solirubrobacteraceae bacterium]|nr:hypothetical protein [Solirubrobacteraceae bacterium]